MRRKQTFHMINSYKGLSLMSVHCLRNVTLYYGFCSWNNMTSMLSCLVYNFAVLYYTSELVGMTTLTLGTWVDDHGCVSFEYVLINLNTDLWVSTLSRFKMSLRKNFLTTSTCELDLRILEWLHKQFWVTLNHPVSSQPLPVVHSLHFFNSLYIRILSYFS